MSKINFSFFGKDTIDKNFPILFIIVGVLGIFFLDKLTKLLLTNQTIHNQGAFIFGSLFVVATGIMLYLVIIRMQKVLKNIETSYENFRQEEKNRLAPYEFSLDNAGDAIYWLTLDAKFVYVNNSACEMLGYTKDEFLALNLEEMDPNFDRQSAKECMREIRNTPNWTLETTQRKKDGTIIHVEVSGHGFSIDNKDYICAFGRDMTQRIKFRNKITNMNKGLSKSLEEKEILLKEIHHRVKNNMEIISSLLTMQYRRVEDEDTRYILKQSRSRIRTMALVHEFLYLGKNLAYINLSDYINRLVEDIKELYISNNADISVDLHIDQLIFSTNRCIQVGMVLHELCVNSLKYAFKENHDNLLCIHIKKLGDIIHLKIRDNGGGLEDINSLYKSDSIGMQLIHSIIEDQLDGTIAFENNKGLECNIHFPQKEQE